MKSSKPWKIAIDLDGTLCQSTKSEDWDKAKPIQENIVIVNRLTEEGHEVIIHTARPWYLYDMTKEWLIRNGVKFHSIVMGKLFAHAYLDNLNSTFKEIEQKLL
jgi:uncharacterized HAD superfamily protein